MNNFRQLVLNQFGRVMNERGGAEGDTPLTILPAMEEDEGELDILPIPIENKADVGFWDQYLNYLSRLHVFYDNIKNRKVGKKEFLQRVGEVFTELLKGGARKKQTKKRINSMQKFIYQLQKLIAPKMHNASDLQKQKMLADIGMKSFFIIKNELKKRKVVAQYNQNKKILQDINFNEFERSRKNPKNKNNTWLTFLRLYRQFGKKRKGLTMVKSASIMWKKLKKAGKKEGLTSDELITMYRKKPYVVGRALLGGDNHNRGYDLANKRAQILRNY